MRTFDTGLPFPLRTAIRTAIAVEMQARRKRGPANASGYYDGVVQLPELIEAREDEHGIDVLFAILNGRAPAFAVALGTAEVKPGGIGGSKLSAALRIDAYYVSNQGRDFVDGRLSPDIVASLADSADPGLDVMLEEGRMFLHKYQPELQINGTPIGLAARVHPLMLDREWSVGMDPETGTSVWAQTFGTVVQFDTNPKRDLLPGLPTLRQLHTLATDPANPKNVIITADNPPPPPPRA